VDISSAVSLYDGYCLSAGYTALRGPASNAATTTTEGVGGQTQTAGVTVFTTVTSGSLPASIPSKWLLGMVIGLCAGINTLFALQGS
jgi:hypothetical protein